MSGWRDELTEEERHILILSDLQIELNFIANEEVALVGKLAELLDKMEAVLRETIGG